MRVLPSAPQKYCDLRVKRESTVKVWELPKSFWQQRGSNGLREQFYQPTVDTTFFRSGHKAQKLREAYAAARSTWFDKQPRRRSA